jgi:ribokinase
MSNTEFHFNGKVLCTGSVNMDLVMVMDRLPEPGETVVTDNFERYPGGKGGNQAVASSLLGANVTMLTKLGSDSFSKQLKSSMKKSGVDVNEILTEKEGTAGIAMIRVDSKGQNSISFTPGSNAKFSPDDIKNQTKLFESGTILLSTMEINEETVYAAIRNAKKHGLFVILDPAPVPDLFFPEDIPGLVDIIKPNATEASSICGFKITNEDTVKKGLKKLNELGFKIPIITMGENGVYALCDDEVIYFSALQVKTIDSTAAGDVFSGALAASLSANKPLKKSIEFANVAAALSTTKAGAQTSIPNFSEISHYLSNGG